MVCIFTKTSVESASEYLSKRDDRTKLLQKLNVIMRYIKPKSFNIVITAIMNELIPWRKL